MRRLAFILCLFTLATTTFSPKTSQALQKYERVTVKGSQIQNLRLQNVSGSDFNKDAIDNFDIYHTDNIWDFIPNLNTAGGSNRLRFIQIRGVGERSEFDSVPSTSVGYYYDHIDLSGLSGIVATYDIENLQVLKGPQSHLFGDSSIGGNILVSSAWTQTNQSTAWLGFGSQKSWRLGAKTEVPLNYNLTFKAGVQKQDSQGFINNSFLNENTNSHDELFTNAGLLYLAKNLQIQTSHIYADFKNGYDVWSTSGDKFTTVSDRPGRDDQQTWGHSLEVTKSLSKKSKLILISSLSITDVLYSFDEDWGNNVFWNQVSGWNTDYDYNKVYDRDRRHFHNKAAYQQNIEGGFINAGVHLTTRKDESQITSFQNGAQRKKLESTYTSDHVAYFVGSEKKLSKNLLLNLSGRIENQRIRYSDSNGFAGAPSTRLYGFNAAVNQKIKNHNLIFTLSRGFKGAGFNPEINLTRDQQFFSPESMINHELTWLFRGRLLESKVTLFYMDRNNQQIQTSTQDNPNDPSDFTVFIDNAAATENYGLESEVELFTNSPLHLNLSLGLLKARFNTYKFEVIDYSGRDLAHAPLYTFAVSTVYNWNPKWSFNFRLSGRDEFFYSNSHDQKSSSFAIFSAGAKFRPSAHTQISVWGRNIFDKRYAARGFYFGNEPPNFETTLYTQAAPPLEYGVDLKINF